MNAALSLAHAVGRLFCWATRNVTKNVKFIKLNFAKRLLVLTGKNTVNQSEHQFTF